MRCTKLGKVSVIVVLASFFLKRDWVWKDPLEDSNWITLPVSGGGGGVKRGVKGVYSKSKVERSEWQRMGETRQDRGLQEGRE